LHSGDFFVDLSHNLIRYKLLKNLSIINGYNFLIKVMSMELLSNTNEHLDSFGKKYNVEIPNNLRNIKIYEEIRNFNDAEYIYCIAYELLIRTDEYNSILEEYEPLKNKTNNEMTDEEFSNFRKLIDKMNDLGLKKTSFLGIDCDNDTDHVLKKIEYYNEITTSPWHVRMLHKFQLDSDVNIFYLLAKFSIEIYF
jgi:uncharacterized protein YifN (PemK superfamily)